MRICRGCGGHEECSCGEDAYVDALNKKMDLVEKIRAGEIGNLAYVDLIGVDLSGADLSNAVFAGADLLKANLSGADLSGSNLNGADLRDTNLVDALLCRANFHYSNLSGANLSGANLGGANLCRAVLFGASLYRAKINNTILDPSNTPNADLSAFETIKTRNGSEWIIAYRSGKSIIMGGTRYLPGKIYEAPVFSTCSNTDCHPGIYFCPTPAEAIKWSVRYNSGTNIVRVLVRPYEIQQAGGKYRARWILVDEVVSLAGPREGK